MEAIRGFFNENHYLSNFHLCEVHYEGLTYKSSEAAYQSAKTLDMNIRHNFTWMIPSFAKAEGKLLEKQFNLFRQDWYTIKYDIMFDIVTDKFTRHEDLKQKLIDTKNVYLEETNHWKDTFWGVCDGIGKNNLGKILMQIRNNLITNNK